MVDRELHLVDGGRNPAPAGIPDLSGDYLNARRFLDSYGHEIRYSPELDRSYLWNDSWWAEDRLDRDLELASTTIDDLRRWVADAGNPDEFKRRSAHYQGSAKAGRRESLLSIVRTDPDVVVAVDDLPPSATTPSGSSPTRRRRWAEFTASSMLSESYVPRHFSRSTTRIGTGTWTSFCAMPIWP